MSSLGGDRIMMLYRNTYLVIALSVVSVVAALAAAPEKPVQPVQVVNPISIDPLANLIKAQQYGPWTVATPTQHQTVLLWDADQNLPNGSSLSASVNCAGHKEMRFALFSEPIEYPNNVVVFVYWKVQTPSGWQEYLGGYSLFRAPQQLGQGEYGSPPFIFHFGGTCIFTTPVMSDDCRIEVENDTGASLIIKPSWVYLVN